MTPPEFIAAISQPARESMRTTRIPASFTIAQGALESSWGNSQLARAAKNLFGVKADPEWRGPVLTMPTREVINGQWVMIEARWRKYDFWLQCIDDHARFFHDNPRYAACFPADGSMLDGEAFAHAVAAAGYATDPQYADKVIATMRARNLKEFDK